MSEENMEVVRRLIDHFSETGDFLWDLYDPDVVFTMRSELGHSTYRGTDGMRQELESFREAWGGGLTVDHGGAITVVREPVPWSQDPFARIFPRTVVRSELFCEVPPPAGPVVERYAGVAWPGGRFA